MRMTEYHGIGTLRADPQMFDVVKSKNNQAADLEGRSLRQFLCPVLRINVSAYCSHRSNSLQFGENRRIPNISCMNNEIRSLEGVECFRAEQSMSIRDHADRDD